VRRFVRRPGFVAAAFSLLLGIAWAAGIKPLDAPDEVAHLQAVMEVRNHHRLPEIHYDIGNPAGEVVGTPGDESARAYAQSLGAVDPYMNIPYESMQPPLFYISAGLVAQLVQPPDPKVILYVSRLVAVFFGAGAVYFCWAATRQLAPKAPMWAVAVAAVVALLPQYNFNSATAANDSSLNFASAAAFYVWFRGLRRPGYDWWMLKGGALLGLAILGKLTAVALIPGLALVVLFRAFQVRAGPSKWAGRLRRGLELSAGALAGALAVCGWWLVRNQIVYGEISGSSEAIQFYTGKFVHLDFNDPHSTEVFLRNFWESLWGRFGWMSISLDHALYEQAGMVTIVLFGLSGFALLGLAARWALLRKGVPTHAWQAALVMLVVVATLAAGFVQFNQTVALQAQGRYFFPVILPMVLLFTGGLYALAPGRFLKTVALGAPLLWLAFLNAIGLSMVYLIL
jgi:4-amino-4-deoxy-L-arabinose transferase-like glycosyltransferase